MRKLKVLMITLRSDLGGGPQHIYDLVRTLRRHEDVAVAIASPLDPPFGERFVELSDDFFELPHRSFSISKFMELSRFCRENGVDIVHSHGRGAGLYSRLLKLRGYPLIHTFHGIHKERGLKGWIKFQVDKWLCRIGGAFICVSEDERKRALDTGLAPSGANIHVIRNGIEYEERPTDGLVSNSDLAPKFKPLIFTVARNDGAKGMDIWLEFASRFVREYPGRCRFLAIGPGLPDLVASLSLPQDMEIRGSLERNMVRSIYRQSFVYLSCSRTEGMPLAVLEALAAGRHCLLSDISGHRYFAENGVARLFDLSDYQSFRNSLLTCLDHDGSLSEKARSFVLEKHSLQTMADSTLALYRNQN